ncbi:MAG TPA: TonB-dependent receptor [Gemmatimonadales bacterium]|nr:TonB-dependent receptor [Gemmatimonadales bacterium]
MRSGWIVVLVAGLAVPGRAGIARAQQPTPHDTTRQDGDTSHEKPTTLEEVTVTARRATRTAPASVVSVSPDLIQRTPAIDPYDLLRLTAGIEVHDQGQGPGFASDASIRGFSSDHSTDIATWVDGVPLNEPINGHAEGYNDWSLLFPQAISSVDVLKGPTSPLYGNFALAGVVNVRTLERMQGTQAWLMGGAYGRLAGTGLTGFANPGGSGVFGARAVHEDGWRPNSAYTLGQVHGRFVRDLSAKTTLDAGIELYGTEWDSPGFLSLEQFTQQDWNVVSNPTDGGFKRRGQERASLRVLARPNLLWRSTVYATQGRWQLFLTTPPEGGETEGSGSQTEEEDTRYGFGATSALTWGGSRGTLTVGAEGRWTHAHYENWFVTDRVRDSAQTLVAARQLSGGLFLEGTGDVARGLRVSVGGRLDAQHTRSTPDGGPSSSGSQQILSPKLGALYHIPRLFDVYANVSRGFRSSDGLITDPALPLITAWAYETGIKYDTPRIDATAAVFQMDVSNEQSFDPLTLTTTNGGRSRRRGVDLDLRTRPIDALSFNTNWTFTNARYLDFISSDGDTLSGLRVFNTARFVGIATVEVGPPAGIWRARLSTNVVGPYTPFNEPGVELPTYALIHLSGDVQLGHALVGLGIRNLFDRVYPELRAGGFVVPGQPRSVYASVQYVF